MIENLIRRSDIKERNLFSISFLENMRVKKNRKRSKKYVDELIFKSCEEIFFFIRDLNKIYGLDLFLYFKESKCEVNNVIIYDFNDLLNKNTQLYIKWYKFKKLYKLNTYYKDISYSDDEYEEHILYLFKSFRQFLEFKTEYTSKVFEGNTYIFSKKILSKKQNSVIILLNKVKNSLISFFKKENFVIERERDNNENYNEENTTNRRKRNLNEEIRTGNNGRNE